MQKYYSASKLTQAAIELFDAGTPMNPAGVRGFATIFTYDETIDTLYHGKTCTLGDRIFASSAAEYIASVNVALANNINVDAATARATGVMLNVIFKGKRNVTQSNTTQTTIEASTTEATNIQESGTAGIIAGEGAGEDSPVGTSEVLQEGTSLDGVLSQPVVAEVKTDAPDLAYAKRLKSSATPKKDLEDYALTFGITLDRRKSFDAMIVTLGNNL